MNNMSNLQEACVVGFLKRASEHGLSEQEATQLLKQANPLAALRGVLGQIAKSPQAQALGGGLRTAGKDIRRAIIDNPRTGIAAKQLIHNADQIIPQGLDRLGQVWTNRAQQGAANLAARAAKLPKGTLRADMLDAVARAAAGVPAGRMAGHAHDALLGSYGQARQGFIDMLRRQGVDLRAGHFSPPTQRPAPAQDLINRIRLGLGRLGDMGTTLFPGASAPINVSVG